jgi:hypothetical protein
MREEYSNFDLLLARSFISIHKNTIPVEMYKGIDAGIGAAESSETSLGFLRQRTSTSSLRCKALPGQLRVYFDMELFFTSLHA